MNYKEEFIKIFSDKITRDGSDLLLKWLEESDFFRAPASAKYHCAKESGLVEHSVKVYKILRDKHFDVDTDSEESFAVCALLHDVCKANFYKVSTRNVKNETTGVWEKHPYYSIEDCFPYGHGEKSVFIIERFMRLKSYEAIAIRWHMAGFDDAVKGGSFSAGLAFEKYPICVKLSLADLESSYIYEKNTSSVQNNHQNINLF